MPRTPLAVVVPTRNRPAMLAHCLTALRAELGPDDEVVVADSASDDALAVARVAEEGRARVVRCEVKGASRARNAGWRATDKELVVFVDDDVVVLPGWADALVAAAAPADVGFVSGRTVAPAGVEGQPATVTWGRPDEVVDLLTRGAFAASNNLLVRRTALERTGGFDERLGPGTWLEAGEDLEMLDRVLATGLQGRYAHDAAAAHEQWRDRRARLRLELSYGKGMGARFASLLRHDRRRAVQQWPELFRLGGLITLLRRGRGAAQEQPVATNEPVQDKDLSGVAGPLLWRLGALIGLVVGLVVLRPGPGAPSGSQVPLDH